MRYEVLTILSTFNVIVAVPILCFAVYVAYKEQYEIKRRRRRQQEAGQYQPDVRVVHGFVFTVPSTQGAEESSPGSQRAHKS